MSHLSRPIKYAPAPPARPTTGIFRFDFEEQDLDEATVRRLVWREMSYYHPSQH